MTEHCPHVVPERLARIETILERVDKAVNGNSHPGLVQRVVALEHRWAWILGASAALGAVSGFLTPAIKAALK